MKRMIDTDKLLKWLKTERQHYWNAFEQRESGYNAGRFSSYDDLFRDIKNGKFDIDRREGDAS